MDIRQYDYLWTDEKRDYVLVKGMTGYSIIDRTTDRFLLIENEVLHNEIVEKMLQKGIPVFESVLHLQNNSQPINIVGQPTKADDFPVKRYKLFVEWSKATPLIVQVKKLKKTFPIIKKQSNQQLLEIARNSERWQFDLLYLDKNQKTEILKLAEAHNLQIIFEPDELREIF